MNVLRRWRSAWPTPALVFFGLLFVVGYIAQSHYGVSSDEPTLLKYGIDTLAYLQGGPAPTIIDWNFHNPIIQVVLTVLQNIQGSTMGTDIWFLRHWVNFLMFFITVACFFRIAMRISPDWKLPLLGCAFFVLSPRLFAHAFYNPKDIPTLLFFTASMLTLLRYREYPSIDRLIMHALLCAILVSLRSIGLVIVGFTFWSILRSTSWKVAGKATGWYTLALVFFTIGLWPRLWSSPVTHFIQAMTSGTVRAGGTLYMGEVTTSTPWHYAFVWIGITTPLLYSGLFLTGTIGFLVTALKRPIAMIKELPDELLFFLWFWLPIAGLIATGSGIFNEWRHLLFVYPGFLLLALFGVQMVWHWLTGKKWLQRGAIAILALCTGSTALWMIRNHPYEYAYFSVPTSLVKDRFEMDYWGLSYKPALEYILATDTKSSIDVYAAERIAVGSALTIPNEQLQRLNLVDASDAEYIVDAMITNDYKPRFPEDTLLKNIEVDGLTIINIYRNP